MKKLLLTAVLNLVAINTVFAQHAPYAGQHEREIKSLSNEEIADYLQGRGMGYAKAAELNRFPGPRHVLDLSKELSLTSTQREQTQAIFNSMQSEAARLGTQLVDKERALDREFAASRIDRENLARLVTEIGALQAQIRQVHLQAHLDQKQILDDQQITLYAQLRGYTDNHQESHIRHQH